MSEKVTPRNVNRAYLFSDVSMASDQTSHIADFKEMVCGSIQAFWTGNDTIDGALSLEASCDAEHWDQIKGSPTTIDTPRLTKLWDLGMIGYRYVRVVYLHGTCSTGTLSAIAIGKISR
jgi:hypothetical protein